jgi:hypothetical protein
VLGCNSASPPAQTDIQTDLEDYAAIGPIVSARIAEENLPSPVAVSIQRPKPDEAVVNVECGAAPKQKKVLTLKKRDGHWTFESPKQPEP